MTREQLSLITSAIQDKINAQQIFANRLAFRVNDDDYNELTEDEVRLIADTMLNLTMMSDELGIYVEHCLARYVDNLEEIADETLRS